MVAEEGEQVCAVARHLAGARRGEERDEAGPSDLERAGRLQQRLGEAAADAHDLAHRLHLGGERVVCACELLEGEAGDLHDGVVDDRLEGGRRLGRDVVGELVEPVADGEQRGDLGNREAGGLGGQRAAPRDARVELDDDAPTVGRVDRELDVAAARVDADAADDGERLVAHRLILDVGQRLRRRDGDGVARVDAHRVEFLDGADDDHVVGLVAHHLELILLPAEERLFDEELVDRRAFEAVADHLLELLPVVGDAAAGPAEREGGADDGREADAGGDLKGLFDRVGIAGGSHVDADLLHRHLELLAIFGALDRVVVCAKQLHPELFQHAVLVEGLGQVERRLAAHGGEDGVGPLLGDDVAHIGGRERLHIGGVGQLRVGHDGGRVGVDQDDPVALLPQRTHRLGAGVVKLAGLTDDNGPRSDDEDGTDIRTLGHA